MKKLYGLYLAAETAPKTYMEQLELGQNLGMGLSDDGDVRYTPLISMS
ncbi:MAG: hypothetical protein LBJ72_10570 [Dysgonamonadaceae bacterium]|jgi:hypothetical protein|nr:hypothetical protein [Dysgonamonadaceae bacterium]